MRVWERDGALRLLRNRWRAIAIREVRLWVSTSHYTSAHYAFSPSSLVLLQSLRGPSGLSANRGAAVGALAA
jgi:hypothetical protein